MYYNWKSLCLVHGEYIFFEFSLIFSQNLKIWTLEFLVDVFDWSSKLLIAKKILLFLWIIIFNKPIKKAHIIKNKLSISKKVLM